MIPADEMEQLIKEFVSHEKEISDDEFYTIKSFPEIFIMKIPSYYSIKLMSKYKQDSDVTKRYEEFRNELSSRKITIENKILETDLAIAMYGAKDDSIFNLDCKIFDIYYKNCIFTSPFYFITYNCENCIVEKE